MECKCGAWNTQAIKTESFICSNTHCNYWLTIKEYYLCPVCGKRYVIEYSGLASEINQEEIENED